MVGTRSAAFSSGKRYLHTLFQRLQTRVANRQAPVVASLIKNANGRLKFISGLVVAGASGPGASSSPVHVTPAPSAPSSVNSIVAFWNILDIASTGVVKMTYLLSCPRSEIPRVASGTLRAIFSGLSFRVCLLLAYVKI